jgi:hypothetical protein
MYDALVVHVSQPLGDVPKLSLIVSSGVVRNQANKILQVPTD